MYTRNRASGFCMSKDSVRINRTKTARPTSRSLQSPLALARVGIAALLIFGMTPALGQTPSNSGSGGNSESGKRFFENLGCNKCHGSEGEGVVGAGANAGVPRIASTSLSKTDFIQQVRKPKGVMPAFSREKVSDAELGDVHAYLKSLNPTAEQPASAASASKGERLFKNYGCYECHGYLGQGSTSTGGSRLGPPRIPLSAFVSYIREPSGQMPPYASKVVSDEDVSEIYNFLKSVPPAPPLKSVPLWNQ